MPAPAFAQQSSASEAGKWEIEVHAGGMRTGRPTAAETAMPPEAESFMAVNGRPSRYVSSWYFGDGSALKNQQAAAFPTPRSTRIVPLDPILTGVAATSSDAPNFGLRVARRLTPRLSAEFNLDYAPSRLEWLDSALTHIEASRASVANSWREDFASGFGLNGVATSVTEIDGGDGGQLVSSGTLTLRLRRSGTLIPYVTGGLGGAFHRGRRPSATLKGTLSFDFIFLAIGGTQVTFNESDTVTVRLSEPDLSLVGVIGGGFTHDLSSRHGFRADVRFHLKPNAVDTEISASPAIAPANPAFRVASATTPSVQHSNLAPAEARSSLSGPAITAFRTREGSGLHTDTALTVGYFWRF